jgi:predicted peroxiredoxin
MAKHKQFIDNEGFRMVGKKKKKKVRRPHGPKLLEVMRISK